MNLLITFINCGKVNIQSNKDCCDFYVQDFLIIYNIIIPHFLNYPIHNIKSLDFFLKKLAYSLTYLEPCCKKSKYF